MSHSRTVSWVSSMLHAVLLACVPSASDDRPSPPERPVESPLPVSEPGEELADDGVLGNGFAGEEVTRCDFSGMTPPEMLSGAAVRYTPEALAARVSGRVIARCTITREGAVEHCRILVGRPFMDEAVIEALESRRYRPVLYQGKPISVSYTFSVKLQLP
ncbi:energy transducer TonB [Archangium lipolyticum]|uniref:energy transducer TonB n=1 Tax=Archangium lipolyticum TaxID=2970465 RepID=UPI002149B88D|nr:energy transducer TonB [Archangium lipolyticum]